MKELHLTKKDFRLQGIPMSRTLRGRINALVRHSIQLGNSVWARLCEVTNGH